MKLSFFCAVEKILTYERMSATDVLSDGYRASVVSARGFFSGLYTGCAVSIARLGDYIKGNAGESQKWPCTGIFFLGDHL